MVRQAMSRLTLCALGAGLLAGCTTVGPDYKGPNSAVLKSPAAQGKFVGAAGLPVDADAPPQDWWRLYDDPLLDRLVGEALAANTDLRVAAANLERTEVTIHEAKDAYGPEVETEVASERRQFSTQSYLRETPIPPLTVGSVGIRVAYQLDLFGQLKRLVEAAEADAEASRAVRDAVRVTVVANVVRAYVEACSAGEELAATRSVVNIQEKSAGVLRRLGRAGRIARTDAFRADARTEEGRAALPVFEARRKTALYRLAVLTGRPPAEFPIEVANCAEPPHLTRPVPVGDGASLLQRRPDVREAERDLAAATARIGVAIGELYPRISLGAGLGSTGILSDLGTRPANHWSLGPLISWSLPTPAVRSRIHQANAKADASLAQFDGIVLNALREVETSLTSYGRDLDRHARLELARNLSVKARDDAQILYRAGRTPLLDLLDAQRAAAEAEAVLATSKARIADDQVSLFLALGGGWEQGES
ncbi:MULTISPECIES: efflux transporter outer membrane subunit [Sphingobium]|uniref:TolC family protein n=1 Tax=Sphingobium agri TaxID=2933566 RepID=A0ABT0E1Q6_9SPHN|nr:MULTISPECIES: TolC family protein [Sphingobium]MCK0533304.1 TolC family protein [Sphingobium agri]